MKIQWKIVCCKMKIFSIFLKTQLVHRPSTQKKKKNWCTDHHHHPPSKTPHQKKKQPPTTKPPLSIQMTATVNQKSRSEKPAKRQPPSTKKNLYELRSKTQETKNIIWKSNPGRGEIGDSHQKLNTVVGPKAVQERRERWICAEETWWGFVVPMMVVGVG